jgi:hypothetical protein
MNDRSDRQAFLSEARIIAAAGGASRTSQKSKALLSKIHSLPILGQIKAVFVLF